MSSDFERLVASANPAAAGRAYQPTSNNNSQQTRRSLDNDNPFLIDDFDEYDDTPVANTRFHNHQAQYPPDSSAPYSDEQHRGHQPPLNPLDDPIDVYDQHPGSLARGQSSSSKRSVHGRGQPEGWIFDADDASNNASTLNVDGGGAAFDGSKMFSSTFNESSEGLRVGGLNRPKRSLFSMGKTWKWPWEKEKVLVGERIIFLNDEGANAEAGYVSNYVSTSKYNAVTFLPKFLYGENTRRCRSTQAGAHLLK
jgi:phospholipid-transporting ATPase